MELKHKKTLNVVALLASICSTAALGAETETSQRTAVATDTQRALDNIAELALAPPRRLPTSPAEAAELLRRADSAEAHGKDLSTRYRSASADYLKELNALRDDEFKEGGGLEGSSGGQASVHS